MNGQEHGTDTRFRRLQEYLADGWEIDPPIFVRPVWHSLHRSQDAYHFILRRQDALHLLVVPRAPDVDLFVKNKRYPLNHL
jgi:hypothetical protein